MPVLLAHGARRRARSTASCCARRAASSRASCRSWNRRRTREAGQRVQPRVAQAAAADPVRASCSCRCGARRRPGSRRPTRTCSRSWPRTTRCRASCSSTARSPSCKSTYTDKLPRAGERAHRARAHQLSRRRSRRPGGCHRTIRTCRTSRSARPEGRRIRQAFIAPPGCVLAGGRLLADRAAHHGAPVRATRACCAAFAEDRDMHRATAAEVFGVALRRGHRATSAATPRSINFGLIYGMSAFGLARNLGIERGAAQQYIERYFAALPGREALHGRDARAARASAATSRRCSAGACTCPTSAPATRQLRQYAERSAINAPMQGTAADIIKRAMIAVRGLVRRATARRAPDHAGARRAGVRGAARPRSTRSTRGGARAHGERRRAQRAAARRRRQSAPTGTRRTRSTGGRRPR